MAVELSAEHFKYMNLGRRYWDAELSQATEEQRNVLRPYVVNLKKMIAQGVGLYLCGPNGTGKTHMTTALLKEAWRRWRVTGYCVTAAELKEAWIRDRPAHEGSEETVIERVEGCRLLVIDDLGKEHRASSGFAQTQFGALLRYRSRQRLTTILTTNLKPPEFTEVYGLSTAKLLKECTLPVMMSGPDIRDLAATRIQRAIAK